MKTILARQLAVVVDHAVQRDVRVGRVVGKHRREKGNVELAVRVAASVRVERATKIAVEFFGAPRERSVLRDAVFPELRDRFVVAARQAGKRVLPVPLPVDVEEMMRWFLVEAGGPPGVWIDGALHDHRAIGLEHRPQLRRQQRDRAVHDELVRREPPCVRGRRHGND